MESPNQDHTDEAATNAVPVEFNDGDSDNPLEWTPAYKWLVVILASMLSLMTQIATLITAPLSPQILQDLAAGKQLYLTLIVSIWELGEVFGPILYGPLSEEYGRARVLTICNALLVVFIAATALSVNISMLVGFRFLSGLVVASTAICPGILGDLFLPEQRGHPMTVMILASLAGPAIGPIVGSYVGEYKGWRWSLWIAVILCGVISVVFFFLYRESYKVVLLKRKAQRLQKQTPEKQYRTHYDEAQGRSLIQRLARAFARPLVMLVTSPILLVLTIYVGVVNGYVYLMFTIIASVFQEIYNFSQGASGLALLGLVAGLLVGTLFCGFLFDVYVKRISARGKRVTPEMRLPPAAISGFICPVGFFLFGWTVQYGVHWIVPIVATALIGFSFVATSLAVRIYLVDAFGIHAVSAMSASLIVRNLAATFLPLAAPPMFTRLGYGWGSSILGFIALALVPIPILLIRFGERIRHGGSYKVIQ